jgi:hypothetical protein
VTLTADLEINNILLVENFGVIETVQLVAVGVPFVVVVSVLYVEFTTCNTLPVGIDPTANLFVVVMFCVLSIVKATVFAPPVVKTRLPVVSPV